MSLTVQERNMQAMAAELKITTERSFTLSEQLRKVETAMSGQEQRLQRLEQQLLALTAGSRGRGPTAGG